MRNRLLRMVSCTACGQRCSGWAGGGHRRDAPHRRAWSGVSGRSGRKRGCAGPCGAGRRGLVRDDEGRDEAGRERDEEDWCGIVRGKTKQCGQDEAGRPALTSSTSGWATASGFSRASVSCSGRPQGPADAMAPGAPVTSAERRAR